LQDLINNSNVFLDTKKILGEWCKYVSFIKINHVEYDRTIHTINEINIYDKMIITRSDEGCEYQNKLYPVEKVNIKDVSGAGDTFISGLVCEYVNTKDIIKAIKVCSRMRNYSSTKKGSMHNMNMKEYYEMYLTLHQNKICRRLHVLGTDYDFALDCWMFVVWIFLVFSFDTICSISFCLERTLLF